MGAITGTNVYCGELAGEVRLIHITATLAAASDEITLTAGSHGGLTSIVGVVGANIKTGMGANFQHLQVSYSGLVVTVVSKNAAGGDATTFGNIELTLLIKTTA